MDVLDFYMLSIKPSKLLCIVSLSLIAGLVSNTVPEERVVNASYCTSNADVYNIWGGFSNTTRREKAPCDLLPCQYRREKGVKRPGSDPINHNYGDRASPVSHALVSYY